MRYEKDLLRNYVDTCEIKVFDKQICVKLADNLALKYDAGVYDDYLNHISDCFKRIKNLGFTMPGNANPIFYIYLIPDELGIKLLNIHIVVLKLFQYPYAIFHILLFS